MHPELTDAAEARALRLQVFTLPSFASANFAAFCDLRLDQADEALNRDEIDEASRLLHEYAIAATAGEVPATARSLEVAERWISMSTAAMWGRGSFAAASKKNPPDVSP